MYCTNSGRKFVDYKVTLNAIRYAIVSEYDVALFEQTLNTRIDELVEDGFNIVGIAYRTDADVFSAVIEYASPDDIYYERKEVQE